jgi:hypothetical protein
MATCCHLFIRLRRPGRLGMLSAVVNTGGGEDAEADDVARQIRELEVDLLEEQSMAEAGSHSGSEHNPRDNSSGGT